MNLSSTGDIGQRYSVSLSRCLVEELSSILDTRNQPATWSATLQILDTWSGVNIQNVTKTWRNIGHHVRL